MSLSEVLVQVADDLKGDGWDATSQRTRIRVRGLLRLAARRLSDLPESGPPGKRRHTAHEDLHQWLPGPPPAPGSYWVRPPTGPDQLLEVDQEDLGNWPEGVEWKAKP